MCSYSESFTAVLHLPHSKPSIPCKGRLFQLVFNNYPVNVSDYEKLYLRKNLYSQLSCVCFKVFCCVWFVVFLLLLFPSSPKISSVVPNEKRKQHKSYNTAYVIALAFEITPPTTGPFTSMHSEKQHCRDKKGIREDRFQRDKEIQEKACCSDVEKTGHLFVSSPC